MSAAPALELLVDRLGVVEVGLVGREVLAHGAVGQPVADADGDPVEDREHVELRQRQLGEAVDAGGEAQADQVEPAAAPRSRPVTVPNSPPRSRIALRALRVGLARERPGADARQVGLGDAERPRSIRVGPMPRPTHAPPAIGFDEVTNGYVPWSRSSSVPWAPSQSTGSPSSSAPLTISDVSAMNGARSARRSRSVGLGQLVLVERPMAVELVEQLVLHLERGLDLLRAGSSRRAGPARGCRRARPCRRRSGRCRAASCRSAARPSVSSESASSIRCHGMIRCALPEMRRPLDVEPARLEPVELLASAPRGRARRRCRARRACPGRGCRSAAAGTCTSRRRCTSVWPALLPPW